MSDANRKPPLDAAESETLSMCGNSMHENRETLETPLPVAAGKGRTGKAFAVARHARLQGVGRSHSTDEAGEQSRPEGGGGVRGGKGTDQGKRHSNLTRCRTQCRESEASVGVAYEKRRRGKSARPPIVITQGKSRMR